jgi:hypothetical protein
MAKVTLNMMLISLLEKSFMQKNSLHPHVLSSVFENHIVFFLLTAVKFQFLQMGVCLIQLGKLSYTIHPLILVIYLTFSAY